MKRINDYEYDDEAIIIPGEGGIGDIFHYVNGKYALHQRVYRIHFTDTRVNTKFAYHYMKGFFKSFIMRKVDASKEFVKVTKNNRLSAENIQRIVSAVAERKDELHFARLVPNDEVGSKQNNYNLSVSTYVEQEDTREKIDIMKLNAEIAEIVAREQVLRDEIAKIIAEIEV